MQAMVLAAGFGTRLLPYTGLRPKPLFPVLNRPLLAHILDQLHRLNAGRITVNGHHLALQIKRFLNGQALPVFFQHEEEVLGTGGALRRLGAGAADGPLLVINGDIFHNIDLAAVLKSHQQSGALVTMVLHRFPRFAAIELDTEKKNVAAIHRGGALTRMSGDLFSFTGIQILDPTVLTGIPAVGAHDIIDLYRDILAAGGRIAASVVSGHYWRDIGTPADYLALHRDLLVGDMSGAHRRLPFFVDKSASVARAQLEDWACIGAGVRLGAGVRIARSVVWEGARVPDNTVVADRIVCGGPDCSGHP